MRLFAAIALGILVASCGGTRRGIGPDDGPRGVEAFPLPSNTYKVGQVVAIYTRPEKVSIIADPKLDSLALMRSSTTEFTGSEASTARANLQASVDSAAGAGASGSRIRSSSVSYRNTRIVQADQTTLAGSLAELLNRNPTAKSLIRSLEERDVKLTVIESLYIADVSISFKDENGASVAVDAPTLQRVEAALGIDFTSTSEGLVSGTALAIGYQVSPDVLPHVLKELSP